MPRRLHAGALAIAATLTAGSIATLTNAPVAGAEPDCRPYVLGIGGTGQRVLDQSGQPSIMRELLASYGNDHRTESLDYPSSIWPTGPYTKDESVSVGTATAVAKIDAYRAECPDGDVTLIGHSLGAEVAGNLQDRADRTVLYGDPRASTGIYQALPGIVPGISSPGARELGPTTVSVCHEFDVVCDAPAPWSDPVHFGLALQGYLTGWHAYTPDEADGLPPGEHMMDMPSPNPALPDSVPTGLPPVAEPMPLPKWEPGPLPSLQDLALPVLPDPGPYVPTPVRDLVPAEIAAVLPPEVAAFVPPPLPTLPDLGIRLP